MKKNIVISIILFLVLVGAGVLLWEKQEQSTQKLPVTSTPIPETTSKSASSEDLVWYGVSELGIKFLVPKDLSNDLIYSYVGEVSPKNLNGKHVGKVKTVNFSTKSVVSSLGKSCSPDLGGLGSVSRYEGNIDQYDAIKNATETKQLSTFTVHYGGSQETCAMKEKSKEEIISATKRYLEFFSSKKFLDSIEEL